MIFQLVISSCALVSVWLAGRKNIHAWTLLCIAHTVGLNYFYLTGQFGLIPLSVGLVVASCRNFYLWRKDVRTVSSDLLRPGTVSR